MSIDFNSIALSTVDTLVKKKTQGNSGSDSSKIDLGNLLNGSAGGGSSVESLQSQVDKLKSVASEKGASGFFKKLGQALSGKLSKLAKGIESSASSVQAEKQAEGQKAQAQANSAQNAGSSGMQIGNSAADSGMSAANSAMKSMSMKDSSGLESGSMTYQKQAMDVTKGKASGLSGFSQYIAGEQGANTEIAAAQSQQEVGMAANTQAANVVSVAGTLSGVANTVNNVIGFLEKMGPAMEAAAVTLEGLSAAANAIPFVGPAISAVLKVAAKVLKGVAKLVKTIGKTLKGICKQIINVANKLKQVGTKIQQFAAKLINLAAQKLGLANGKKEVHVSGAKNLYNEIISEFKKDGEQSGKNREVSPAVTLAQIWRENKSGSVGQQMSSPIAKAGSKSSVLKTGGAFSSLATSANSPSSTNTGASIFGARQQTIFG